MITMGKSIRPIIMKIIEIIIMSLFIEDTIFSASTDLTNGPHKNG